jgi:hypothetical protein
VPFDAEPAAEAEAEAAAAALSAAFSIDSLRCRRELGVLCTDSPEPEEAVAGGAAEADGCLGGIAIGTELALRTTGLDADEGAAAEADTAEPEAEDETEAEAEAEAEDESGLRLGLAAEAGSWVKAAVAAAGPRECGDACGEAFGEEEAAYGLLEALE